MDEVEELKKKVADLEEQLALAKEGLEVASGVMSYCQGDAWERECTEKDRARFDEIYETFNPKPPPQPATFWYYKNMENKVPCPVCGKKVGETTGLKAHMKAKHEEGAVVRVKDAKVQGGLKVSSLSAMINGASSST
jgi:hypothetical protein